MGDRLQNGHGKPYLYVTSHPGQLSLAIPPRVGKMSIGLLAMITAIAREETVSSA